MQRNRPTRKTLIVMLRSRCVRRSEDSDARGFMHQNLVNQKVFNCKYSKPAIISFGNLRGAETKYKDKAGVISS